MTCTHKNSQHLNHGSKNTSGYKSKRHLLPDLRAPAEAGRTYSATQSQEVNSWLKKLNFSCVAVFKRKVS